MDTSRDMYIKNKGIVYKRTISTHVVHSEGNVRSFDISAHLRNKLVYPTAAVGSLHHVVVDVKDIDSFIRIRAGD